MYQSGFEKISDVHWRCIKSNTAEDGTYILFNPMKTAAEIDSGFGNWMKFSAAMGKTA